MWRKHPTNPSQLRQVGCPEDDLYFPLSSSVVKSYEKHKTLESRHVENLDIPMNIVKKMYFPNTNQNILFSAGNEQSERAPRVFLAEDLTKAFTSNDAEYSFGYSKIVFTGFNKCPEDTKTFRNKPDLERAVFDPLGGQSPACNSELPTSNEPESRQFLDLPKASYYLWAGCPEVDDPATLGFCCDLVEEGSTNSTEALRRRHDFALLHHRVFCPKNDSIHTIISHFDLNRPSLDGQHFVHILSIRPDNGARGKFDPQTSPLIRKHFPRVAHLTQLNSNAGLFSELECGAVCPSAAMTAALWKEKRRKFIWHRHDYLSASPRFNDEVVLLAQSLPAPTLPNKDQLFNFAAAYEHLLTENAWPYPEVSGNPNPKSAADPG